MWSSSKKNGGPPSEKPPYPTQAGTAYPVQPTKSPQHGYGNQMPAGTPAIVRDCPPPYYYSSVAAPMYGQPYYGQPNMGQPYMGQPYGGVSQGYVQPVMQPMFAPNSDVIVQGGFDAGARFDGISKPNIPPPPPGCIPNAAQLASAQGCNVSVTQRPDNFFTGGSDGGVSFS